MEGKRAQRMNIERIHHATMVSSDAQKTVDFYTRVLGMRLVKQTVNYDQPETHHLYFGNQNADPGSLLTFFVWPGTRRGNEGIGGTHHIAMTTKDRETQLRWKRWLMDNDVRVWGPYDRVYFHSIYFNDPDGLILEIATEGPGFTVDEAPDSLGQEIKYPPYHALRGGRDEEKIELETWPDPMTAVDPEMTLHPIHHISVIGTNGDRILGFYNEIVGLPTVKRTVNFDNPDSPHLYVGADGGQPGSIITYFVYEQGGFRPFRMGTGVTHHFALEVPDVDELQRWKDHLSEHGIDSSDIRDRTYFQSVYFHDPDGQILELATAGPGFTADESIDELGTSLKLPEHLEPKRDEIESNLPVLTV
jgi:glyoxalase family protein